MSKCPGTVQVKAHMREGINVSGYERKCGNHNENEQKEKDLTLKQIPTYSRGASKEQNKEFVSLAEACMAFSLKMSNNLPIREKELSYMNEYGVIKTCYPNLYNEMKSGFYFQDRPIIQASETGSSVPVSNEKKDEKFYLVNEADALSRKPSLDIFKKLVLHEGGYSNRPTDSGKATNWGVTQVTLDTYNNAHSDMKIPKKVEDITKADAYQIFKTNYWDDIKGDKFTVPSFAHSLVDFVYNSGKSNGVKKFKEALKKVSENTDFPDTGGVDDKMLEAVNGLPAEKHNDFHKEFAFQRGGFLMDSMKKKPNNMDHLGGWMNRTKALIPDKQHKKDFEDKVLREFIPIIFGHYDTKKKISARDPNDKTKTIENEIDMKYIKGRLRCLERNLNAKVTDNHRNLFLIERRKEGTLSTGAVSTIMGYQDIKDGIKFLQKNVNAVREESHKNAGLPGVSKLVMVDGYMGNETLGVINAMTDKEIDRLDLLLGGNKKKVSLQPRKNK